MTRADQTGGVPEGAPVKLQLRLLRDVLTRYRRFDEFENGFRLDYPPGSIGDGTLRDLRKAWPQVEFEAVPGTGEDAESVGLRITLPPDAKERLRSVLESDPSLFRRPSMLRWRARLLTSPVRMLPDFIVIGTSKAGTTTLFYDLVQHPCVADPWRKELFYFDRDYTRGALRYRAHFPTRLTRSMRRLGGRPFVTGEASPTYLEHPQVPQRVRRLVPDARLIVILRDPVKRAHSLYNLKTSTGLEKLPFEEAIAREERELEQERERVAADDRYFSPLLHHFAYVSGGIYADHLQRWTEFFPREQLLVLSSDELRERRDETYDRLLDFLGLPAHTLPVHRNLNRSQYQPMDDAIRTRLREYFRPHNERLWEFLGVDWGWNDPS